MAYGFPVLCFEPSEELVFRDKLGHVTGVQLIVKNKNLDEIYFKVKSTASKFYSVRPSSGTIKPHGQVKVIIQPHDDSAKSLDVIEENNHRFMIQSAFVDNKSPKTADEFWQSFDKGKVPVTTCKLHDVEAVVRKEDQEKKTINGNLSNIPSIPLVRDIVENIGLVTNTVEEVQNGVKADDMKDGKIDDASELEKVIGKDNKEEGNIVKDKFKNLNGAANAVANAEIIVENNEEIQITFKKSSNLNFDPSNGDCTEEMRVQMESPLPNNQPSHFTIANTSTNENKIDNLSSTMFKQQKPLFNSSQFCYYPMPFVEPAFQSGAESGNGYYGNL
uniref:Major sperm protein n=1 Tax=Meloidogyne javanica TaxID=6303 RepID=A0A915N1T4_MELJA